MAEETTTIASEPTESMGRAQALLIKAEEAADANDHQRSHLYSQLAQAWLQMQSMSQTYV